MEQNNTERKVIPIIIFLIILNFLTESKIPLLISLTIAILSLNKYTREKIFNILSVFGKFIFLLTLTTIYLLIIFPVGIIYKLVHTSEFRKAQKDSSFEDSFKRFSVGDFKKTF